MRLDVHKNAIALLGKKWLLLLLKYNIDHSSLCILLGLGLDRFEFDTPMIHTIIFHDLYLFTSLPDYVINLKLWGEQVKILNPYGTVLYWQLGMELAECLACQSWSFMPGLCFTLLRGTGNYFLCPSHNCMLLTTFFSCYLMQNCTKSTVMNMTILHNISHSNGNPDNPDSTM